MKRTIYLSLMLALSVLAVQAQRVNFEITLQPQPENELQVYVQPRTCDDVKAVSMRQKNGSSLTGKVPGSDTGFYNIVVVKDNAQLMTLVYVGSTDEVKLSVEVEGRNLRVADTASNRLLSAFNSVVSANARLLWTKPGMSSEELKSLLLSYSQVADSLLTLESVPEPVAGFLKVWAYTSAYDAYTSIPHAQNIEATTVGFGVYDILPAPHSVLDCDYAPLFYSTFRIIAEDMPAEAEHLLDKLELLQNYYRNEAVRKMARAKFIASFLSKHNYSADFEGGLSTLRKATEIYGLPEDYVNEYLKRKATIVGSPFPADVVLEDANGNIVDFSSFKGKYVYIDLWASWCGPCRKEIPHLQTIEAELHGGDVVFLSISTDTDTDAWKNSMEVLNMHGNQLHDRDNTLCNALNVKGIPFFLVYDKDGNLHTYGAMRPSKGELLKNFLNSLE